MRRLGNSITYEVWKSAALIGASLVFLVTSFLLLFVVAGVAHAGVRAFITLFHALVVCSVGGDWSRASETKGGQ